MQYIKVLTQQLYIMIAILGFLIINVLYYGQAWQQVIYPDPSGILTAQGESHIYELVAEKVRENILLGNNPFSPISSVMYPTGWNFAPDDVAPINGFYFILLRPLFSIHQAFMLITVLGVLLSNVSMYLLLRQIGHQKPVAFLVSLLFGFTPFVSYRIWGHPTYVAFYIFSLPALFFILLLKNKKSSRGVWYTIGLAISLALAPLTNLYFTVMMGLLVAVVITVGLVFERKLLINTIRKIVKPLIVAILLSLTLLTPWLVMVLKSLARYGYSEARPVTDSVLLSADLLSPLWPARNPFYAPLVDSLSNKLNFKPWFETFMYPGIILLTLSLLYIKIRNKLNSFLLVLYTSAGMLLILTLGPFLRIGGHTSTINLPYQLLYRLPFIQMARAPARFIVPVIFLLSLVGASVLSFLLRKTAQTKKLLVITILVGIVIVDHSVLPAKVETIILPVNIYNYLSTHPQGPLLEIPFTVRDGIKNFGYANSVWTTRAQILHGHPVFSIYAGRVPTQLFENYKSDPLLKTFGALVDVTTKDQSQVVNQFDIKAAQQSVEKYQLQYVLLKNNETYSDVSGILLDELGFSPKMHDSGYTLWKK